MMSNDELTTDTADLQLLEVEPEPDRLVVLRKIVEEHQATEIDGVLVDATTASMLVKCCDALNNKNLAKFLSFPITMMADIGWKLVN